MKKYTRYQIDIAVATSGTQPREDTRLYRRAIDYRLSKGESLYDAVDHAHWDVKRYQEKHNSQKRV